MPDTRYGISVSLDVPHSEAVARATVALTSQGFGVLTSIDVQQTLKAKLDREFRKYVILGGVGDNRQLVEVAQDADRRLRLAPASLETDG